MGAPARLLAFCLTATTSFQLLAADPLSNWGQWRGPLATGEAPKANPPVNWSESSNIKWKVSLPGHGSSTPIVWEDTIFLLSAIPTGKKVENPPAVQEPPREEPPQGEQRRRRFGGASEKPNEVHQFVVLALNRKDGSIRWQQTAREEVPHEGHHRDHSYASYSPVTDGKSVFAFFGSRGLHAYDFKGKLQWSKDLGKMQTKLSFGEGSSPALHNGILVVNWDHEGEDFTAAFDASTGKELWRQKREEDTSWTTPLIVEHEGRAQVITAATKRIRSYDLKTGELIWECGGLTANAIPTPVAGNGMVYITSGFRGSALLAIKLGRTGDLTDSDAIAWKYNRSTPYVPSPLLYEDRLYFFSSNNGVLSCFDAKTGEPVFTEQRFEQLQGVYASPVAAAGRIYLVGRNGTTVVLKDGQEAELLAANKLEDRIDASPALVGRELFLRGAQSLYCISEN